MSHPRATIPLFTGGAALCSACLGLTLAAACLGLFAGPAAAGEGNPPEHRADKVLVLFTGGLSLADWQAAEAPNLRALARQGTVGIMNVRSAGAFTPENAYATFSAGERALGSPEAGHVFAAGAQYEKSRAGEVFARRTGFTPPPGALMVMDLPRLLKNNDRLDMVFGLGTFGGTLERAGIKTAVIGNADTLEGPGREAALAVMNERGMVFTGEVGTGLYRLNPLKPWGMETDYEQLLSELERILPRADCIIVELGDTSRVEKYREFLLPAQGEEQRLQASAAADLFFGTLLERIILDRTLLLLVTPFPSRDAVEQGDTLTPVLAAGPGFGAGLFYSPSSRRPGIITFPDLQSTIFAAFDVPAPAGFPGRPLTWIPQNDPFQVLQKTNDRVIRIHNARGPVLKGFVVVQIILFLLVLVVILRPPRRLWVFGGLRFLLAGITAVPFALLVLPLGGIPGVFGATLYLALAVLAAGLLTRVKGLDGPLVPGLLALGTAVLILIDLFRQSLLMSESLLGFSPVGGARYYGIGNEYLGVLLGGSITGSSVLLDRLRGGLFAHARAWIIILFGVWLYAAAAPWLGANLGGAVALSVAYLVTGFSLFERRLTGRRILLVAAGGIGLLVLLGWTDFLRDSGAQSHLGRLVSLVKAEGAAAAGPVILRKIRMNLTLVEYTIWSRVFLTLVFVLAVLFLHPGKKLAGIACRFPAVGKGIRATLAGSITALVVNDSGIVAAATGLLFPVVVLTFLILEDCLVGAG